MSTADCSFKSLTSASANELLQNQCSLTFRLLKTVADFSQALANLHDKFGHELQVLVENFRKRNGELRKERSLLPASLVQIWELLLQQVEVNSQHHGDISRNLSVTVGSGLIEQVFHRKIQSKKVFAHWDRIEAILSKSNELLHKCHAEYSQAYANALTNPAQYMSDYISAHNVYVHQLQATNGMIHAYQTRALPRLLEELEECHLETSQCLSSGLLEASELVSEKSNEQMAGQQVIASACRQANPRADLAQLVRALEAADKDKQQQQQHQQQEQAAGGQSTATGELARPANLRYHQFQAPAAPTTACGGSGRQVAASGDTSGANGEQPLVPTFKNEIAPNPSQPQAQQQPQLEKERSAIEERIEQLEARTESLAKMLARATESRLHNKANELQEELSQCRFELLTAHLHLSAVRSQLQLFEYNFRSASSTAAAANATAGPLCQLSSQHQQHLQGAAGNPLDLLPGQQLHDHQQHQLPHQHLHAGGPLGGYRNKWIEALKSLKEKPAPVALCQSSSKSSTAAAEEAIARNAASAGGQEPQGTGGSSQVHLSKQEQQQQLEKPHCFQEYTFKKIASCDVCKEFLRGHMRQGVKCKLCKTSCHNECQSKANATIRCQQPKMKLLRRQKSAGELEVNTSDMDGSEGSGDRTNLSSKPDSLYQLFKQVLEAKKRGDRSATSAAPQTADERASNQQLLGSLSLANQNGKSVSTSALGGSGTAAAGVDRWAVVMELLAQSRGKVGQDELTPSKQRHSKQLDKFKSAAKSAAAASRHQREHMHQSKGTPEVAGEQSRGGGSPRAGGDQLQHHTTTHLQPLQASNSSPLAHQQHQTLVGAPILAGRQLPTEPGTAKYLLADTAGCLGPPHQQQLQHTQSLPMDQQQAQHQLHQQQQQLHHHHQQQPPPWVELNDMMLNQPGSSAHAFPIHGVGPAVGHPQIPYHPHQHQLLGINNPQSQSTSAPHSPQRKRFNLRMKSFSLDSPESPSLAPITGAPGGRPGPTTADSAGSDQQVHQQTTPFYATDTQYHQHQQSSYSQQPVTIYPPELVGVSQHYQQQQQYQCRKQSLSGLTEPLPGMFYAHRHSYQNDYENHLSGSLRALNSAASAHQLDRLSSDRKHASVTNAGSSSKRVDALQNLDYYDLSGGAAGSGAGAMDGLVVGPGSSNGQQQQQPQSSNTYVVLYDYLAQRADEIQLSAGQIVCLLDASERDWWEIRVLDGSNRCGFFPSTYLAELYQNERPLQVAQTIQVSTRDSCEKLLRGQVSTSELAGSSAMSDSYELALTSVIERLDCDTRR